MYRTLRIVAWFVAWFVAGTAVLAWTFLLRPVQFGGPAAYGVVRGDSMRGTYTNGDLVVTRARDHYQIGDVIAFDPPRFGDLLVIHRIVSGNARDGYTTRGDNRDYADPWTVQPRTIIGRAWHHVPALGGIGARYLTPFNVAIGSAVVMFVLVITCRPRRTWAAPELQGRSFQ